MTFQNQAVRKGAKLRASLIDTLLIIQQFVPQCKMHADMPLATPPISSLFHYPVAIQCQSAKDYIHIHF